MSWNNAIRWGTALLHKQTDAKNASTTPDVPLNARIGGLLRLQQTPFIRAQIDGSLILAPSEQEDRIVAISRVKLGEAGDLYRLFLATEETSSTLKFVQAFRDAEGRVSEFQYFSSVTSFVPETREDQDLFTGRAGQGLGDLHYSLFKGQLAGDLPESVLDAAFSSEETPVVFNRDGGGSQDFVLPYQAKETRVETEDGSHGLNQEVFFTPYRRQVGQTQEHLLISTQIVSSSDGDDQKRSIRVWFFAGIPLELDRIQVL